MSRRALFALLLIFSVNAVPAPAAAAQFIHFFGSDPGDSPFTHIPGGQTFSTGELITHLEIDFASPPTSITGGRLSFESPLVPKSSTFDPDCGGSAEYGPGGSFKLTGSVFGLPVDTMLLSGTFIASSLSSRLCIPFTPFTIFSSFDFTAFGNPAFLSHLGIDTGVSVGFSSFNILRSEGSTLASVGVYAPEPHLTAMIVFCGALLLTVALRRRSCRGAV